MAALEVILATEPYATWAALAVSGGLLFLLATAVSRRCQRGSTRRGVWQIALLSLLCHTVWESAGGGWFLADLRQPSGAASVTATAPHARWSAPPLHGAEVRQQNGRVPLLPASENRPDRGPLPNRALAPVAPHRQAPAAALVETLDMLAAGRLPPAPLILSRHEGTGAPVWSPAAAAENIPGERLLASLSDVPLAIWLLGVAACGSVVGFRQLATLRFRLQCEPSPVEVLPGLLDGDRALPGLPRRIRLLAHPRLRSPVAFGMVRPTVVVPADFRQRFSSAEQRAILTHELSHLAARDPCWNLLADLTSGLLWWHPLVWLSRRQFREACEWAADEATAATEGGPQQLAEALLRIGRELQPRRWGWLAVEGNGFRSQLGRRVARLLELHRESAPLPARRSLGLQRVGLTAVLVLVLAFGTAWARPGPSPPQGDSTMSAVPSSWRRALWATALVSLLGPATPVSANEETSTSPTPTPETDADLDDPFAAAADRANRFGGPRSRPPAGTSPARRPESGEQVREALERRRDEIRSRYEEAIQEGSERSMTHRLRTELHRVEQMLHQLRREAETGRPGRERPEPRETPINLPLHEMHEVLAHLHERLESGELAAEDAERVERQVQRIRQLIEAAEQATTRTPWRRGDEGRPPLPRFSRPEMERRPPTGRRMSDPIDPFDPHRTPRDERWQHLRTAVENLQAAGLHEQAEAIARQARELAGPLPPEHRPHEFDGHPLHPHSGLHPHRAPPLEELVRELAGTVHQLQLQVERLHGEIAELRGHRDLRGHREEATDTEAWREDPPNEVFGDAFFGNDLEVAPPLDVPGDSDEVITGVNEALSEVDEALSEDDDVDD